MEVHELAGLLTIHAPLDAGWDAIYPPIIDTTSDIINFIFWSITHLCIEIFICKHKIDLRIAYINYNNKQPKMDHYTIYIEEGKYNTNACNRNEVPTISNNIMCLAALVLLTFIGLIQYSATVIADE